MTRPSLDPKIELLSWLVLTSKHPGNPTREMPLLACFDEPLGGADKRAALLARFDELTISRIGKRLAYLSPPQRFELALFFKGIPELSFCFVLSEEP